MKKGLSILLIFMSILLTNCKKKDSTLANLRAEFPMQIHEFKLASASLRNNTIYSYEYEISITNLTENTIDYAIFEDILIIWITSRN